MADSLATRIKNAWNVFCGRRVFEKEDAGTGYFYRPDRARFTRGNDRTTIASVFNRIALDCAAISIKHVRATESDRFLEPIHSGLNDCFNLEANIDQTGRAFVQDVVMSMLDEGVVALVPIDTKTNPMTGAYDILSMRVAKITQWYPKHVKVSVYNADRGKKEELVLPKTYVAIVENPLFSVINEPNSTMQRLIRKLALLDAVDEQASSGKLDLIIQLPYAIKNDYQRAQAEERRKTIEDQLYNTKYGIAYTDGTEHITQLNRPIENNLMAQVKYLTELLFSQLGLSQDIMSGTADEKTMLNYYTRTIEPIMSAIVDEVKRKFLTKTARTQGQTVTFFRDMFKLVPVNDLANIADTMTRNEIMTSNEIRQIIGMAPSDDPNADVLMNKNLRRDELGMMNPWGIPEGQYVEQMPEEQAYYPPEYQGDQLVDPAIYEQQ